MRAFLVRVGIDQAFGGWNAPIDPSTGAFVYVPIPEKAGTPFQPGLEKTYEPFRHALSAFSTASPCLLPDELEGLHPHLDPDFHQLTYGDNGIRRGKGLSDLGIGDLVVFFAGMRPTRPCEHRLVYAIIGLYRVGEVVRLRDIPAGRWAENAHTRKLKQGPDDVIVRAQSGVSGRLERAIPIGEFRDKAYRVRRDLLAVWGGLSCRDGFIQRSAVPPAFQDPARFLAWFDAQSPRLIPANNPSMADRPSSSTPVVQRMASMPALPKSTNASTTKVSRPDVNPAVILVHLRQPERSKPNESRTDPIYESGCFGLTGCHNSNLLKETAATGVRLGFIQPGPGVMRLVFLTPPIKVIDHGKRRAAHWEPAEMPLRFKSGLILIDKDGNSDIPGLRAMLEGGQRSTWVGRFSSAFRSRTKPLPAAVAAELVAAWDQKTDKGGGGVRAERYWDALPFTPPKPDTDRGATYQRLLAEAKGEASPNLPPTAPSSSPPTKRKACCR